MPPVASTERQALVLEAIDDGLSMTEIAQLLGVQYTAIAQYLGRLVDDGVIIRVGRGKYQRAVDPRAGAVNGNGHRAPAPAAARRVDLPAYMKQRKPVTLFVERSPQEIEGVARLEIQVGNTWFSMPINEDVRICIGEEIPRWSPTQETYQDVYAYRVTRTNGEQNVYAHDPRTPFTIDFK